MNLETRKMLWGLFLIVLGDMSWHSEAAMITDWWSSATILLIVDTFIILIGLKYVNESLKEPQKTEPSNLNL